MSTENVKRSQVAIVKCHDCISTADAIENRRIKREVMPLTFEEEGERLADQSACANLRAQLKMCLLESDCCRKDKQTPRECLKRNDGTVPQECFALRTGFFECKRSMLDNRARFRGRKGDN